jgi:anti-sigma regulatory factor (Ser/Thr protein kinase)
MARSTVEADPQLIAFTVPGIPASVQIARSNVRAALSLHGLGEFSDDAAAITSELVTNAMQHVRGPSAGTIGVTLTLAWEPVTVTVTVSDFSPEGPIRRDTSADSEQGRGLQVVAALSTHWGWHRQGDGKAVFAVLAREA